MLENKGEEILTCSVSPNLVPLIEQPSVDVLVLSEVHSTQANAQCLLQISHLAPHSWKLMAAPFVWNRGKLKGLVS